ncbi:hypothetical protein HELRODRAFT_101116 [Helobdella robusta]|uniref:Autophagy-related protein 2 n=1 Tax=Helobdella robusta TaxID=6412 RepID=T1ED30_HELRO|nr:hypothetical protein HELRODRAFT_101116 [Helobdella robusta]ESO00348.1 hypothetical protein HELRODRAFT_101116 [Helobdella robusta]
MNKFLHWYSSDKLPKKTFGRMLTVVCVGEKHEVDDVESEYSLKISLQPLKLNIDQDSLMFLYTFFNEISTTASRNPPPTFSAAPSQHATPTRTVRIATPSLQRQQSADLLKFDDDNDDEKLVSNMADLLQQQHVDDSEELLADSKQTSRPIFFKSLQFAPSVLIKIDYRGKRIENNSLVSIVAGLTQLSCSQITLKSLHYRHGLLGFEKLVLYMLNEWMVDVKRNQLTDFLSGVGPMNSLIQLVKGFIDLFWLPLEQYRKDGRILKGLRRGTHSFATCTALSALELTNKMLQAIQLVAEAAHDIVSTGPSIQSKNKLVSKRSGRPIDARDGVTKACALLRQGLANRCTEFCNEVIKEHEQKGVPGVIGEVARQIPPTVIAPVVLAAEASGTVLTGIRNQLVPVRKKEDEDKWKVDSKNKLSFQE